MGTNKDLREDVRDTEEIRIWNNSLEAAKSNGSSERPKRSRDTKKEMENKCAVTDDGDNLKMTPRYELANIDQDMQMAEVQKEVKLPNDVKKKGIQVSEDTGSRVKFKVGTKDNMVSSLRKRTKNTLEKENFVKVVRTGGVKSQTPLTNINFTVIAKSRATVEQQMKLRGLKMVEEKNCEKPR